MSKEEKIIALICQDYSISTDEFNSQYRYGKLSEARQLFCLVLKSLGQRNGEIAGVTGFSPPRVTQNLEAAHKLYNEIPFFRKRHDMLVLKFLLKNVK